MPFESYNWKRFGKILTINPFSYFIAVFRRAFYDKHFDIIVNGAWSHCLELKLSAYNFSKHRCRDRISQKRFPDNYGLDHI